MSERPELIAATGANGRARPPAHPDMGGQTAATHCTYSERNDPVHHARLWQTVLWNGPRWDPAHTTGPHSPITNIHAPSYDPEQLQRALRSPHCATIVGILQQFRHADTKQLMCWLQTDLTNSTKYLGPLYHAGIVERGHYGRGISAGSNPYVYSLHDSKPVRQFLNQLTDDTAQRVLGTTDRKPNFSSRHIRHNVAVTETTLRTLEMGDTITTVDGERNATTRNLFPNDNHEQFDSNIAADAIWYRYDGLRIAIELVMTLDRQHIAAKMARWASAHADTDQRSNLVVVWINATADDHDKTAAVLRRIHTDTFQYGTVRHHNNVLADPDTITRARTRTVLASWYDWYPKPHTVSYAGRDLTIVGTSDGTSWHAAHLAHPASYPLPDRSRHPTPTHQLTPTFAALPPIFSPATPHTA